MAEETRGLRAYLRQKAASMRAAAFAKPGGEHWREQVEAVCTADDLTGVRKLRIRDWQFLSDSGPGFGGWSLGPSSPELLCGVISTCLTHTYLIGAAVLEIPVDHVQVRVSADNNDAAFLDIATDDPPLPFNIAARVELEAPDATDEQTARLHEYAAANCPLTRLIRTPNDVRIITT
jgi:organic hydroperoxide reductase OsmC/OhrA